MECEPDQTDPELERIERYLAGSDVNPEKDILVNMLCSPNEATFVNSP